MSNADDKLKKVLGIGDKIRDLEKDEKIELTEDEQRKRHEDRKEEVKKIKADIKKLKNNDDEKFIKDALREVAGIGLESMRVLQDELEYDPSGRAVECMAAMTNAVTSTLKNLQNLEIDKEKLSLDQQKVDIKRNSAIGHNGTTNNILMVGSVTDVLQSMKDGGFINDAEVNEVADKEEDISTGAGTVFPIEEEN